MTKSREKTREELTAEIEEGKKKIRQFENREKCYDRSYPLRNARRGTTGFARAAALRSALHRPQQNSEISTGTKAEQRMPFSTANTTVSSLV